MSRTNMGTFSSTTDNRTFHFNKNWGYRTALILIMLFPIKQARGSTLEDILNMWTKYKKECIENLEYERSLTTGIYCNGTFDRFACWPSSPPGNVSIPCPSYLQSVKQGSSGHVHRYCSDHGIWQKMENSTEIWRDITECFKNNHFQLNEKDHALLSALQLSYTIGYSVSLGTLALALFILLIFRKLHCTRNYIHMNLFASFIMQALTVLIKDIINHNTDPKKPNDETEWMAYLTSEESITCRVVQVLMHFFSGTNHFWLLVEGIYLHTILVTVVLAKKKLLLRYIVIGWMFPLLFVVPWAIARALFQNYGCWRTNENVGIWWIIRGPMFLTILINLYIFLKILKLLVSKLKAHQTTFMDYKYRLARSTLVLILLLGMHKLVFTSITDELDDGLSKRIRLFIELTMSSFQGFLVATLYCFANGDVRAELRKQRDRCMLRYMPCKSCYFTTKATYKPTKQSKQQRNHYSGKNGYEEVKRPSSVQILHMTVNVIADFNPQHNVPHKYFARVSLSESSDGGLTVSETIGEVLEESET
ncbi:glucagon-like peptide 2 receptor [Ascaphus truei]|uniref:glucagon-like peptide 2 receptor n=1 Tax=Ascaphus truei TaxID=8439 RepID=UPI003F5A5717